MSSDIVAPVPVKCALVGHVVVIKKTGKDGPAFPLKQTVTMIGRHMTCDIRIQLPHVSKQHAKIEVNENSRLVLENLSSSGSTHLNNKAISTVTVLEHGDMINVGDRLFRIEYLSGAAKSENALPYATAAVKTIEAVAAPTIAASTTPLKARQVHSLAPAASPQTKTPTRRSSVAPKTPIAVVAAKTPVKTPAKTPAKIAAESLPSPQVQSVESIAAEPTLEEQFASIPTASASADIKFEASVAQDSAPVPDLSAPLHSVEEETSGFLSPMPPVATTSNRALPTPLRHSILSLTVPETKSALLKPKLSALAKLATPIKKAIQTGRTTLKSVPVAAAAAPAPVEAELEPEVAPLDAPIETEEEAEIAPIAFDAQIEVEVIEAAPVVEEASVVVEAPVEVEAPARKSMTTRRRSSVRPAAAIPSVEAAAVEEPAVDAVAVEAKEEVAVVESAVEVSAEVNSEAEAAVEAAPAACPVKAAATPARRTSARHALPTPIRQGIVTKQSQIVKQKPAPLTMATPLKKSIKAGRAGLKTAAVAPAPESVEEFKEIEQEVVAEPRREVTMHLSSELLQEVESEIPAAAIEEAEVEAEPIEMREVTQHFSREVIEEAATGIAAKRRAMATPLKASIRSATLAPKVIAPKVLSTPLKASIKTATLAPKVIAPKVLSTPLKAAIKKVQPVAKPALASMATPHKKAIRSGRALLKPAFEPVEIEMGESVLPESEQAQLVAVASTAAPARRASMRHAASSSDAQFASRGLASPIKSGLAAAAAEVAQERQAKQARKVLPTPLKKGIKSKPELAHVEPVARIVEPEPEIVIAPPAGGLPTPVRKGIQSRRKPSMAAIPMPSMEEDEEEEKAVEAEALAATEVAQEEADEEVAAVEAAPAVEAEAEVEIVQAEVEAPVEVEAPARKSMTTRRRSSVRPAAVAAVEAEAVEEATVEAAEEAKEEEVAVMESAVEVSAEVNSEAEAAVEAAPAASPVKAAATPARRTSARHALPTPIRQGIVSKQSQIVKQKPAPVTMATPLKKSIRAGRAGLKTAAVASAPVAVESEELAVEAAPEVSADISVVAKEAKEAEANEEDDDDILIIQREPTMRLSIGSAADSDDDEEEEEEKKEEAEVAPIAEAEPEAEEPKSTRRVMSTPMKASIRSATLAPKVIAPKVLSTPLKASIKTATLAPKVIAPKVLSTPLKAAIKKVQPVAKPAPVAVMATPVKRAIRGGRAGLKPVPAKAAEVAAAAVEEVVVANAPVVVAAPKPALVYVAPAPVRIRKAAPAPASPVVERKPVELAPVDLRLQKRREAAHQRTLISSTAKNSAPVAKAPKAAKAVKATKPKAVKAAQPAVVEPPAEVAAVAAPAEAASSVPAAAIQPIFESLLSMPATVEPLSPLAVARGCHSSVPSPETPGRDYKQRWSFLESPVQSAQPEADVEHKAEIEAEIVPVAAIEAAIAEVEVAPVIVEAPVEVEAPVAVEAPARKSVAARRRSSVRPASIAAAVEVEAAEEAVAVAPEAKQEEQPAVMEAESAPVEVEAVVVSVAEAPIVAAAAAVVEADVMPALEQVAALEESKQVEVSTAKIVAEAVPVESVAPSQPQCEESHSSKKGSASEPIVKCGCGSRGGGQPCSKSCACTKSKQGCGEHCWCNSEEARKKNVKCCNKFTADQ